MGWIKRNLYFVIGTGISVLLLGLAGWYLYTKWDLNNQKFGALNQAYEDFKRLNSQNPHPGDGPVDNIKTAKEQTQQLREFITNSHSVFQKIAPIPDLPKISDHDF